LGESTDLIQTVALSPGNLQSAGLRVATYRPVLFLLALLLFLILVCLLLPEPIRGAIAIFQQLGRRLGLSRSRVPAPRETSV